MCACIVGPWIAGAIVTTVVTYVKHESKWYSWCASVDAFLFKKEYLNLSGYVYHGALLLRGVFWPILLSVMIYKFIKNLINTLKEDIDKVMNK